MVFQSSFVKDALWTECSASKRKFVLRPPYREEDVRMYNPSA